MKIENYYSTPVGFFEIDDCNEFNISLTNFIYNIKKDDNSQRSMVGGYHTKEDLLSQNNPFIKQFHNIIAKKISRFYSKRIGPNSKIISWAMIYGAGHYSKVHSHPLADISSSYYCKVPKNLLNGEGEFVHLDPRPNAKWDINFSSNSSNHIKVKEGMGIIFPGWLDHYVTPHTSNEDRICITTNVFLDHGTFFK